MVVNTVYIDIVNVQEQVTVMLTIGQVIDHLGVIDSHRRGKNIRAVAIFATFHVGYFVTMIIAVAIAMNFSC